MYSMLGLIEIAPRCSGPSPGRQVKSGNSLSAMLTLPEDPRTRKLRICWTKSPGHHVMSCFVQYAPYDIEGGWDDAKREAFGETVISTIERYAPNIRRAIVGKQVITPKDIEMIAGITGGNIFHGELLLHQLFFLRPAPQWADFRTPLPGYYFGASGAHPGGGVMGAAGKLAAMEVLKDWK